ncbi:MAG: extracellular solute-binding protein [Microterricola sp.]|uniref:Carbohydrate ABC transporter substrate-binding protein, CUT1 family n=1 Tax=Microbacterium pygmaeum TaxID=370764 RepID=A0A1G7W079_9MICO|nr:extracellular solute-binding protein [Microbacterium pygmaeum]SDG65268.1 carbohydrate ABC transporter substrate-binding protein, CUT1 family [Microbacterium pygmaeum]
MKTRSTRRSMIVTGLALATLLPLSACAGGAAPGASESAGGGAATGTDPETFTVLTANENPTLEAQLTALSEDQCKAENEALPLEHEKVAQADVVQKVTLLASQDSLPAHFIAGTAMVRPDGDLGKADLLVDYQAALEDQGLWDQILPAAASTINNVYGQYVSLPYQYNLEGIWYNKAIFEEVGLDEPQTFDDLVAANEELAAAGYTPMAMAGAQAFPLTRLIGMYIYRNVGLDAMTDIRDGNAKLTDPEYVAGAEALVQMAEAGDFGDGFISQDASVANNQFLTGAAAMKYDGTWLLSNINDEAQNTIGAENIGFMPFPAVEGGAGNIDQWPANAGTAMAMNPKTYGPKVADWLGCIAENYGAQALGDAGVVSGFKVNGEVTDVPETTKMVQEQVAAIDETVLWFEALMDGKSTSLAQSNVSLLVSGQLSPEDYMAQLQTSIDANK